jgi:hypothetical protein
MSNLPNFLSAGVFTSQTDLSGVAQGVADIGAVVVAPFPKGPGFYPTICTSLSDLQTKFGIPDGTYYGPYSAAKYLQEKGFVTVCRVGALTGYHQKYPLMIWADAGEWTRNMDVGELVSGSSTISLVPGVIPAGMSFDTTTVTYSNPASGSFTGKIELRGVNASVKLASGNNTGTVGIDNGSGSLLYSNQTIAGGINANLSFSGALNIPSASFYALTGSAASASILNNILFSSYNLSQSFDYSYTPESMFESTQLVAAQSGSGFYDVMIEGGGLIKSTDHCGNINFLIAGYLSGSFGGLSDEFKANGGGTFDTCSLQWTGAPDRKVLAILANTEWETVNSNLESPGFLGSAFLDPYDSASILNNQYMPADNFNLVLSSSLGGGYGIYNFSLDESDPHYITNVFGNTAIAGNQETYAQGTKIEAAYIYSIFEDTIADVVAQPNKWKVYAAAMPSASIDGKYTGEPLQFTDAYSLAPTTGDSAYSLTNAYSPWVVSQKIAPWNGGSPTRFNLFQLATLADGTYANTSYKIQISNVKLAGQVPASDWGSFNLTVRDFSDTDRKPIIIEQFNNLTLDPNSPNYIARIIGDQYGYINNNGKMFQFGTYSNNSAHIRVIMSTVNYPVTALPFGFAAFSTPIGGAMAASIPAMAYTKASTYGLFPGKYPSGVDFTGAPAGADAELVGLYPTSSLGGVSYDDNKQYFVPLPKGSLAGSNVAFALDDETTMYGVGESSFLTNPTTTSASNAVPAIYDPINENTNIKMRNFQFGFQGGFDGQSPAIDILIGDDMEAGNTQGLNCANSKTAGSVAYNQCIGALGNADQFDINLITTPGIVYSLHSYVTTLVIDMCERVRNGDCFYVADLYEDGGNPSTGQVDEVIGLAATLDTSYAAGYYPWVNILDTNTNQIVTVPPSVVMPAIYAANDAVGGEWWAPAGLNRGGIPSAVSVTDRLIQTERDDLYEGKVNPIVSFPGQGIVVWGQKTLQHKHSALDRINVQRLMIALKKYISSISKYLVFEQNTATTRNKFLSVVNPYMESIQQRSGVYAFQVIMDTSNNTSDIIDQNVLIGSIALQPTRTAEFIYLPFTIVPTGTSFS